jgi:hypothetical protein
MGRALIVLHGPHDRIKATSWIGKAPPGTRVEFKASKRTLPQNALMWVLLTHISIQKEHFGRKYSPDDWKIIFLNALGRETRFIPSLDGTGFIPIGQSSSDLSKEEMTDMIELLFSWGAQNGVNFADDAREAA